MKRTRSALAQRSLSFANALLRGAKQWRSSLQPFGLAAGYAALALSKRIGAGRLVSARVYGHDLLMPAEHPLPSILAQYPQYNSPLAHAAEAIVDCGTTDSPLAVIDVGANIGETVAIIDQRCGDIARYLCIEADPDLAALCELNYAATGRVEVARRFVGEDAGAAVRLQDDGRANPATKRADEPGGGVDADRLVRLDTLAAPFARRHGAIGLIKTDTEGYDFSILRSGSLVLARFRPAVYFEWFPRLLAGVGEESWSGFDQLMALGYAYFVFFTKQGDYYCAVQAPERLFIRSLAAVSLRRDLLDHFDVFASCDPRVHARLIELSSGLVPGHADSGAQVHPV